MISSRKRKPSCTILSLGDVIVIGLSLPPGLLINVLLAGLKLKAP